LYLYIVVVVGTVEMWKSHFNVDTKGNGIHSPCGNCCGNLLRTVEISDADKDFHISTGAFSPNLWKCGNL
jgi:hypothetical protein